MQKTILIVLDGVGDYKDYLGNAVTQANTPFFDSLYQTYPWTDVNASGNAVGVPEGVQGASEPGHLTMGAGRVVFQPYEAINQAIKSGSFFENKAYTDCLDFVKKNDSTLHLLGMISDGGVHSDLKHLFALLDMAKQNGISKVMIHGITDGRDVPEKSAQSYTDQIYIKTKELGVGTLATLIGRYYGMDRDTNYDRVQKAYDLIVRGEGELFDNAGDALTRFYQNTTGDTCTDYYLPPAKFLDQNKFIQQGDGVIFFNFRSDRSRELSAAFAGGDFSFFAIEQDVTVPNIHFVCTGPYSDSLPVAFPPEQVTNNVGSWMSQHKVKQLRMAETEKYAHVTYFFNSQIEAPYKGEERILINSPKVASYAEKPEMSAFGITERVLTEIASEKYDFILMNFANGDLVGHSGVYPATKKAMEVLDECLSKIVPVALTKNYAVMITADHGNAEYMINDDGTQNPSHTLNLVRTIIMTPQNKPLQLKKGLGLASIGTTVLKLMGLPLAPEMDAETLF